MRWGGAGRRGDPTTGAAAGPRWRVAWDGTRRSELSLPSRVCSHDALFNSISVLPAVTCLNYTKHN